MRPSSQIEIKCWLCPLTFKTRRQLKNHLAAAPHKRLSVICVWCPEEKTYRRMVDLKEHIMTNHRSKIELMPNSFLTENNGFWMANYPETYAKVITPSNENSVEAMKARIEILEFIGRVGNTVRTKEQWVQGWKCPKDLVKGTEEDDEKDAPKKIYSPSRPNIYEDLELKALTLGIDNCTAIFQLDLGVTIRDYQVILRDDVMKEPRMLDSLIRRMTALMNVTYVRTKPFGNRIDGELKIMLGKIVSRKLAVKEEIVKEIKTTEELFPNRNKSAVRPLSPLRTPSTSNIILDEVEEMQDGDNDEETEVQEHRGTKNKHTADETGGSKRRKKDNSTQKEKERMRKEKEERQKRKEEIVRQAEEEHQRKEEEAMRRKEEAELKRKEQEEVDRRRKRKEEALQRKEEAERQIKQQEESDRKRKEEEETQKKKEEALRSKEEAKRQRKDQEEAEERQRKEEADLKRKEEEEAQRRKEEKEHQRKEQEQEEAQRRKDEELQRKEEEAEHQRKEQEEAQRRKDEELQRRDEEEAERQRKEEEEANLKRKEEEESQRRKDEELQRKDEEEAERQRKEKEEADRKKKEEDEELGRREEERQRKEEDKCRKEDQDTVDLRRKHLEHQKEKKELSSTERATKLLRTGGMPLFPPGRRDWKDDQVITLITSPTTLTWPPKDWKKMTSEQKYFNWEFASIALELTVGTPLQLSKEELLLKYHFLALPGTKTPTTEEEKTFEVKSRFYLYTVLRQITQGKTSTVSTNQLLAMLEKAADLRDKSLDSILAKIDELGIGLRLGDNDEN